MAGLDVNEFLETTDESRRSLLLATARAVSELRRSEYDYLAVQIRNQIMEGLSG